MLNQPCSCLLLHGWGLSNTVWSDFVNKLNIFDNVISPCLYEIAANAKDYTFESVATELKKTISADCVVIAWSIGGLIASCLSKQTDKIKGIIFIASTPCFVNKENWNYVIDKKNINDLQKRFSCNQKKALEYFAGLIAQSDVSSKSYNKHLRKHLAKEEHKDVLASWLLQLHTIDQRNEFASLKIPTLVILGGQDTLIKSPIEKQLQALTSNTKCAVLSNSGHAPFLAQEKETIKLINGFINANTGK